MEMMPTVESAEEDPEIFRYRIDDEAYEQAVELFGDQKNDFINNCEKVRVSLPERQKQSVIWIKDAIYEMAVGYGSEQAGGFQTDFIPMKPQDYKKLGYGEKSAAGFISPLNIIVMSYDPSLQGRSNDADFIQSTSHEFLHAFSFQRHLAHSTEKNNQQRSHISPARIGLSTWHPNYPKKHKEGKFNGLNEAITESLAKDITDTVINQHARYFAGTASTGLVRDNDFLTQKNADVSPQDDFRYSYPRDKMIYQKEIKIFDELVEAVAQKRPDLGSAGVKKLFYEAYFGDSMVTLGRLMEETLGRGAFRVIAEDFKSVRQDLLYTGRDL